jgi:hypothetical protein
MRCPRCKGIMAYEKFLSNFDRFYGWRCVQCGEIIDPLIMDNRTLKNFMDRNSSKLKK